MGASLSWHRSPLQGNEQAGLGTVGVRGNARREIWVTARRRTRGISRRATGAPQPRRRRDDEVIRQKSQENATLVEWIVPRGLLPRRRDARKSLGRQTFVQTVKQPAHPGYISCSSETPGDFRYRSGLISKMSACQRQEAVRLRARRFGGPPTQHWLVGSRSDPTLAEAVRPPLKHGSDVWGEIRLGGPGGTAHEGPVDRYGTGVFMSV